jgi:hypothetical protein
MKHKYVLWTGHLLLLILLTNGIRWLAGHIRGMSDLNMLLSLAVMTGLVLNHIRWWKLRNSLERGEVLEKLDLLVIGNYSILVLLLPVIHLL